MEVLYYFTVASGLPGDASDYTMKANGQQLQRACKTRWLLSEWSMVNGFIVSYDSANKQKQYKSHRMQ